MKSSEDELRERGWLEDRDIEIASALPIEQLLKLIDSYHASDRSAAIKMLAIKCSCDNEEYVSSLLKRLCVEKALYTKIEICRALELGNRSTAAWMCEYLGQIGSNQHKVVPDTVSKKKSYPLPRDIIARSLARMDIIVLPILLETLTNGNKKKVYEVIDAIGFMIFYNQDLATIANLYKVQAALEQNPMDDIILWKTTLCYSAFPLIESIELLSKIRDITKNSTIIYEIERSLKLIQNRIEILI